MDIQGYLHFHVRNREILNVFVHLTGLPQEGEYMLHIPAEVVNVRTIQQFQDEYPQDRDESWISPYKAIFDLGDKTIHDLLVIDKGRK